MGSIDDSFVGTAVEIAPAIIKSITIGDAGTISTGNFPNIHFIIRHSRRARCEIGTTVVIEIVDLDRTGDSESGKQRSES